MTLLGVGFNICVDLVR